MTTLTVVSLSLYSFSVTSLGWATLPIILVLIVNGWAVGFVVLGLMLRFGPSAEILTWGLNYVLLAVSGVFFPASALPGGLGHVAAVMPSGLAFASMRTVLSGGAVPWGDLGVAAVGSLCVLALALTFAAWMLRVFRRRGFVTRYS
jgi:ABC-2 type transport system permease protein